MRRKPVKTAERLSRRGITLASLDTIMTILELIVYVVIAVICGAIARAIAGGSGGGFLVSLVVGFLGAFIGTWLARNLGLPPIFAVTIGGHSFPVVWAILGGIVLVVIAQLLVGPRYRRPIFP